MDSAAKAIVGRRNRAAMLKMWLREIEIERKVNAGSRPWNDELQAEGVGAAYINTAQVCTTVDHVAQNTKWQRVEVRLFRSSTQGCQQCQSGTLASEAFLRSSERSRRLRCSSARLCDR